MKTVFPLFPCCFAPHCLSISPFPSLTFTPDLAGNLAQLAERLKLSDPLVVERRRGDRDPEPAWLAPLRQRRQELVVSGAGAGPGAETFVLLFAPLAPSRQALNVANPSPHGGP